MIWTATKRYGVDPAPGGLALVQDLLNTRSDVLNGQVDMLDIVEAAAGWGEAALAAWCAAAGEPAAEPVDLRGSGRDQVRARVELLLLRERLHGLLAHREHGTGETPGDSAAERLNVSLGPDGTARVRAHGSGWHQLAALVLLEIYRAQLTGEWPRLKTCRNPVCRIAFYDRSRNSTGVWHDVRTCGNQANLRASRDRRRG
jgi:predicted RNA-binding Zn ribbon-like protein